jgi:PAS domain S-box-containing protein
MKDQSKTKQVLIQELALLKQRIKELEQEGLQRRQAEEALRETQNLLNEVGEIAKIGGWKMNLINRKAAWTQGTYDIVEIEPGAPIPGPDEHIDYYLPEYRPLVVEAMRALIEDDKPLDFEAQLRTAKGNVKWCRGMGRVVRESGKAVEVCGTFQDITERKRAEEALQESEERYRMIFDNAPLGIMHFDSSGTIINFNDKFAQIMGAPREKILGFNMLERLRDQEMLRAVRDALSGRHGYYEGEYLSVTGQRTTPMRAIYQSITGDDGKFIGAVGLFEDITERKRAEAALRESEEKYRAIFENAVEGIFQSLPEGRYISVNPAFARIGGFESPDEMIKEVTNIQKQMYVHQDDRTKLIELINKQGKVNNYESEIRRRDGSIIWISTNVRAIRDQNGKIILLEGTMEDITERKQAEEEIRKLNVELEQRVAARTAELEERTRQMESFSYSVSHDLKAPLRGIDGYSRLLMEDCYDSLDEQGRTFLTTIRQATEQMRQLIDDLLAYSRMERRSLVSHEVHPLALMQALLAERTEEIHTRNVSITVGIPDVVVKADPEGLAQVLRNLLDNALKFTGKVPDPHIEIGGQEKGKTCTLWVRDNGIGFDMRHHDRIFEIFQRLHAAEDYPGTGIGMAIVQKTMQRMGGRVWAESAPGKGSAFFLEIPR